MMRRHDTVLANYCSFLRSQGKRIASEVGLPGGRADAVRLDALGRWLEIYEVKTRAPAAGIAQLQHYASLVSSNPRLTLVVTPRCASREIEEAAEAAGIRYEVFEGCQQELFHEFNDLWVHLPFLHPVSAEVARQKARATRERHEREEVAA